MSDMKALTVGMLLDMFAEASNDNEDYTPLATQEDFDAFAHGAF